MADPDKTQGLSSDGAAQKLEEIGPNKLPEASLPGPLEIFARQFLDPFIYMLAAAAVISLALGQIPSTIFIILVLLLNAVIGTIQEYSAQKSAAALRSLVTGDVTVIRDGKKQKVDTTEIVPGDLVLLESGDKVPADIELTESEGLRIDESLLTGESETVEKDHEAQGDEETPASERTNWCFAGTMINRGRGRGFVKATANQTELGQIASEVGKSDKSKPPLLNRIEDFTYQCGGAIAVAIVVLILLMLLRGGYGWEEMTLMAVGLAVSAIPEGLPAALTVALAVGMNAMARRNVVIRKLVAVEALGSCTFICSDKTGTLTVNEMTARKMWLPGDNEFKTTGEGISGGKVEGPSEHMENLKTLCLAGACANEGELDTSDEEWQATGDVVDIAFLVLAEKAEISAENYKEIQNIPYESDKAYSGSVRKVEDGAMLFVKGSPETISQMCDHIVKPEGKSQIDRQAIQNQVDAMASQGYRLIALARKEVDPDAGIEEQATEMEFLGLVGLIDPLRSEAKDAIEKARNAGVEVAMITGDHPETAKSIAMELGLIDEENDTVVTGGQLEKANDQERKDLVKDARVFARIQPKQKKIIVEILMEQGHYVAVTGDGVNDAPAIKAANAGIAMGRRGTDVARETAELILTDDNFASIVAGIEQGRVVYNNIRKVIAMLIATAFSAILLFFCSASAGLPIPMTAVQLLWLNLVANGVQDVSLAFEPKEGDELKYPPRNPKEPIFERKIVQHVLLAGTVMGLSAFGTYYTLLQSGYEVEQARNLVLMLMVLFGNIHTLNNRSETKSLFSIPLFSNRFLIIAVPLVQLLHIGAMYMPGLSDVLEIQPIALKDWITLLSVAVLLLIVEELHKLWHRRRDRKQTRN